MRKIKVGIGFATGRRSFQKVLKTNILNWNESGLTGLENVSLNLFVAYDLKYSGTNPSDYRNIRADLRSQLDGVFFIGATRIREDVSFLNSRGVISPQEARLLFESGYAGKRNAILYEAIKQGMDCLLFLDDDEYPMAVTKTRDVAIWSGQHVLKTHLEHIWNADVTQGYHCGYVSPIPSFDFDDNLTEEDLKIWIQALSNDILNWENMRKVIAQGGVTYADIDVLVKGQIHEVQQSNNAKFISGSNLCLNLTEPARVQPFYNPPGARGEDTFLSTCLADRRVIKVPCYTFHDGFSAYRTLMDGVLPLHLKSIDGASERVAARFFNACIGWVRYKPLYLNITQRENYERDIERMRDQIATVAPKMRNYFKRYDFGDVLKELNRFHRNVEKHHHSFQDTRSVWSRVTHFLEPNNSREVC